MISLNCEMSPDSLFVGDSTLCIACGFDDVGSLTRPLFAFLSQGKKDQIALDISQQGHQDGMFSVSFKEPMDSVQAFATAVAVLRCREPFLPVTTKRAADPKRKPPRFPLRQVNNGNEANLLRQIEGQINMTGGGYFVSCPADPPLSPYHHRS